MVESKNINGKIIIYRLIRHLEVGIRVRVRVRNTTQY